MTTNELKSAIQAAVYENSTGAITGTALQDILLTMVDMLSAPVLNMDNITSTSMTDTAANCAAYLGVSEAVFLRMAAGECPVVISEAVGGAHRLSSLLKTATTGILHYELVGNIRLLIASNDNNTFYLSVASN